MARVDFKGIYFLWRPLKNKGEGMSQILLSHIRILSKMPFPDRLKRWEAGRASQGSKNTPLWVLDGWQKVLSAAEGSPTPGSVPRLASWDIQGHDQLWLTAGILDIWTRLFPPEESGPGVQAIGRQKEKGSGKAAVCIQDDPCSPAPAETNSLRGLSLLWGQEPK